MRTTLLCVTFRARISSRRPYLMSSAAAGSAMISGRMTLIATARASSDPRLVDRAHAADAELPDDV